ncbi:DNA helicase [Rhodoblastus sphagnicola]|uniref:DNA 3'-5' helicase n=1 Tax=Rhodoblastus sphagnicola TaxID=333368 RepID=A0A2S6N5P2_9HYPH|nr:3'-5' exonuclease [Rhodoblastus sphagnicola]MBB4201035.1 superfamily I DNA/RNA helicase [Rhodoblastus sphagnicola]PPQ29931.1 DNA helicase [Rhodoblastus sphagnicola]
MEFRIADTFTDALARLAANEQKAVKTTAFDLQMDPSSPGLSFHRIDNSKDANFWSVRANADIRIIVHKTAASMLLAYVDHHDKAYAWAERRRIEAHPKTGAVQIVEVRERVVEVAPQLPFGAPIVASGAKPTKAPIFKSLSTDDLLAIGVPEDWLADVARATEDRFLDIAGHLPAEASEALLEYAATGDLNRPAPARPADPFAHPDTLRRIRVVENAEHLALALDYPWDKWTVFLHPSQRAFVGKEFSGPARIAGSAGTGKTVVALHRAARLVETTPNARLLLTTFSDPLSRALERKVRILVGPDSRVIPSISVASFQGVALDLFQLAFGHRAHVATEDRVWAILAEVSSTISVSEFSERFIRSEWTNVVDAWQVNNAEAYGQVPRLGRKNRMSVKQRDRLWPVFEAARAALLSQGLMTWSQIFGKLTGHFAGRAEKPFTHIVVDEAQDLGVPELRFFAAIASGGANALFFAGDIGQRIFQQPFSWKALGVDVRGRSATLKVNYRTSHEIRQAADRLLPSVLRDVDGVEDQRKGTVSLFSGPEPIVALAPDENAELPTIVDFVKQALADGIAAHEIGIFTRGADQLPRARAVVKACGLSALELSGRGDDPAGRMSVGTMHLAKGLEFKAVIVMACDDEVLPLQSRVEAVADEVELDEVYETERQLLYVACTRARDRLLVTGVAPGSEFLADLKLPI